ncbi:MAG TPA: hypothetical protein VME42_14680 [Steroidobacteraceae bacterium]|nr:hypothetical protein [Steroidobacteraceae bacterium]
MNEPMIWFPVTCPKCGAETLGEHPVSVVAAAILGGPSDLELYAPCHDHHWRPSEEELVQIRQYLGAWLSDTPSHRAVVH